METRGRVAEIGKNSVTIGRVTLKGRPRTGLTVGDTAYVHADADGNILEYLPAARAVKTGDDLSEHILCGRVPSLTEKDAETFKGMDEERISALSGGARSGLPGIGDKKAESIKLYLAMQGPGEGTFRALLDVLPELTWDAYRAAAETDERWLSMAEIKKDPYGFLGRLGLPFKEADPVSQALGVRGEDDRRLSAAAKAAFRETSLSVSPCCPVDVFPRLLSALTGLSIKCTDEWLRKALWDGREYIGYGDEENVYVYPASAYRAEVILAGDVAAAAGRKIALRGRKADIPDGWEDMLSDMPAYPVFTALCDGEKLAEATRLAFPTSEVRLCHADEAGTLQQPADDEKIVTIVDGANNVPYAAYMALFGSLGKKERLVLTADDPLPGDKGITGCVFRELFRSAACSQGDSTPGHSGAEEASGGDGTPRFSGLHSMIREIAAGKGGTLLPETDGYDT